MKVIRDLEITAEEFFGVVFAELQEELRRAGHESADASELRTGFTHVLNGEDPALKTTFQIVEYREYRFYNAVRASASGTAAITYDVTPKEKGITVTFTYDDGQPRKKGLFSAFSDTIYLSRMTDKLYAIQRTVVNEKEGFTEKRSNSPFMPDIRKSK